MDGNSDKNQNNNKKDEDAGEGAPGDAAKGVEAQLRATAKQVTSGKKQAVRSQQQRSSTSTASSRRSSNNNSVNRDVEANLRQTERQVLAGSTGKKHKSSQGKPSLTAATPTTSPTTATAVESNLRQTERQVLSAGKKQEQQQKQQNKSNTTEEEMRRVESDVVNKGGATNETTQVATEMRMTRNHHRDDNDGCYGTPHDSSTQPLAKLDRSLLAPKPDRTSQKDGDQKATIPGAVGPNGQTLSDRDLQQMVGSDGDGYYSETSPPTTSRSTTAVAMGTVLPTLEPPRNEAAFTTTSNNRAATLQQDQFTSDEEAYQRTLQASMADAAQPSSSTSLAAPPEATTEAAATASAEIQAFVAQTAPVTAFAVEEQEAQEQAKFRKILYMVGACVVIVAIVVIVSVVVASGGDNEDGPTTPDTPSPTMAPTTAGEAALVDCLASSPVADVLDIQQLQTNKTSPQFRAVSWMVNEDEMYQGCTSSGDDTTDSKLWERYALVTFYFAVNGPGWGICGQDDPFCAGGGEKVGWLSNNDVCEWFKIWCTDEGSVRRLDFFSNTITPNREKHVLEGTLPRDIGVLSDMEMFVVSTYKLRGPIEGVFTLWNKVLNIWMEDNQFTGTLPTNLDQETPLLRSLRLSGNRVKGEIPTSMGNLASLRDLRLDENELTGSILPSFGNLVNLTRLELQSNQLQGSVPPGLFSLGSLQELYLADNPDLRGEIPLGVGNMARLRRLRLGNTQMGGTLPPDFFWITSLLDFVVPQAVFGGEMDPVQWRNFTDLEELDISFNDFEGQVPDVFHEMSSLEVLRLQGNRLTGTLDVAICENRKNGDLRDLVIDSKINCPAADCCDSCETLEVCDAQGLIGDED